MDATRVLEGYFSSFPVNPDAEYLPEPTPSKGLIVPGQQLAVNNAGSAPMTQFDIDRLAHGPGRFLILAKVEYRDVRTGERHWTHACLNYLQRYKTQTDNGFRTCPEYN